MYLKGMREDGWKRAGLVSENGFEMKFLFQDGEYLFFASAHPSFFCRDEVVLACGVKESVNHVENDFSCVGEAAFFRFPARDVGTDIDFDIRIEFLVILFWEIETRRSQIEADHIGRAVMVQRGFVQFRHAVIRQKDQREIGLFRESSRLCGSNDKFFKNF